MIKQAQRRVLVDHPRPVQTSLIRPKDTGFAEEADRVDLADQRAFAVFCAGVDARDGGAGLDTANPAGTAQDADRFGQVAHGAVGIEIAQAMIPAQVLQVRGR